MREGKKGRRREEMGGRRVGVTGKEEGQKGIQILLQY